MDPIHHLLANWDDVLAGATALGIVAHMVNTFPTPKNKYGAWFLGVVQYTVGQRIAAMNTVKGQQSVVTSVPNTPPPTAPPADPKKPE